MHVQYKFYDATGEEIIDLENDVDQTDSVAKIHEFHNGADYFILVNQFLRPFNITDKNYINESKQIAKVKSGEVFKFMKYSKEAFMSYIKYLQTRNVSYLNGVK